METIMNKNENAEVKQIGNLSLNESNRLLIKRDQEIKLTKKESQLLSLFMQNINKLVPREFALRKIWGSNDYFMGRSMDVYITKLRKLLLREPQLTLINIHKKGFILQYKEK